MLIVGTSGLVYPAASLPYKAEDRGAAVVQINLIKTDFDSLAHWNLTGKVGDVLSELFQKTFPFAL